MLPKGSVWILAGIITISVIVALAFVFSREEDPWCNEKLNEGDCAMYEMGEFGEIHRGCYCIDTIINRTQDMDLYEDALSRCQKRNGTLAVVDIYNLFLWLAKRMYRLGVDKAVVNLVKIFDHWFWVSASGAKKASNLNWRHNFTTSPNHEHAVINVESVKVPYSDEDGYKHYKYLNYDYYLEENKGYEWYGLTTIHSTPQEDLIEARRTYLICHYVSAPKVENTDLKEDASPTATNADLECVCSSEDAGPIVLSALGDSKRFTSARYPRNYCSDLNCRWVVTTAEGLSLMVDWMVLSIENGYDFVYIYDGEQATKTALIEKCTGVSCGEQKSSANAIQIHFNSDHVTTDLGFKFMVTVIDPDPCYCSSTATINLVDLGESYTLY